MLTGLDAFAFGYQVETFTLKIFLTILTSFLLKAVMKLIIWGGVAGLPGPEPQGTGSVSDALQVFSRQVLWIRIRIQHFKWIRIQSGSKALMTKNWEKMQLNIFFLFLIRNCNLLISRPPKTIPSYRRSLQPSKENIQHFEQWNF